MEKESDKSENFKEPISNVLENVDFDNDNKLIDSLIDNIEIIESEEVNNQ